MLSGNSLFMACAIIAGYFYFLGSNHKNDFERTMGDLIAPPGLQTRYEMPQETELASKSPAPAVVAKAVISAAVAEVKALPPTVAPSRAELQQFKTNFSFQQDHSAFQMLRLRAIARHAYKPEMGVLIDERMNLIFFDPSEPNAHTSLSFPVVMNEANGNLGILSGTLIVSMKHISQASFVAQRFGLALKGQDDSLALAYLASPVADELGPLMTELRRDPSVKSVEAEIVQNWKRQ